MNPEVLRAEVVEALPQDDISEPVQAGLDNNVIPLRPTESPADRQFAAEDVIDGTKRFLNSIGKVEVVYEFDEQAKIARKIERGDFEAKTSFIESNLKLIPKIAKKYLWETPSFDFDDAIQEGSIGLVRAVEKFDYRKGYKFSTYAAHWIRQSITRGLQDKADNVRLPIQVQQDIDRLNSFRKMLEAELGREPNDEEIADAMLADSEEIKRLDSLCRNTVSLDKPTEEGGSRYELIKDETVDVQEQTMEEISTEELNKEIENALKLLDYREQFVIAHRYHGEETLVEVGRKIGLTRERVRQIQVSAESKLRKELKPKLI